MSKQKENQCLEEFISLYRSEYCLWKVSSPHYHNKVKKDAAYARLAETWKQIEPLCTKSTILKKINNLRSSYRKEFKKVKDSKKSGTSADDIYEPKLWYYKLLNFLDDQEMPRNSRSSLHSDDESSQNVEEEGLEEDLRTQCITPDFQATSPQVPAIRAPSEIRPKTHARPSVSDSSSLTKEVLKCVKEHFRQPRKPEDRYDVYGKMVAMRLRELDGEQRRFAEKFMNDVLFEAEGGKLDGTYAFVRQVPPQYHSFTPLSAVPQHLYNSSSSSYSCSPTILQSPNRTTSEPPHHSSQQNQHQNHSPQQKNNNQALSNFLTNFNDFS